MYIVETADIRALCVAKGKYLNKYISKMSRIQSQSEDVSFLYRHIVIGNSFQIALLKKCVEEIVLRYKTERERGMFWVPNC